MKGKNRYRRLIGCFALVIFFILAKQVYAATREAELVEGPVKLLYDYTGCYKFNYTGNTNHYDYWNSDGSQKIISRNYKDNTGIVCENNSSAVIEKADNKSEIVKAYLIWETRAKEGALQPISFITPDGSKRSVLAEYACKDLRTNEAGQEYAAVYVFAAEVTNIVCGTNGGYGTYTVADIPVWKGAQGGVPCGGESVASWQLVVVEESENFPLRTISLNLLNEYFYNEDYAVRIEFPEVYAPQGEMMASFINGTLNVDAQYILDGAGSENDYAYEENGYYYRYKTRTRGLYKNGVCINDRDTGSLEQVGSSAIGAVRVHLYNDKRKASSIESQKLMYRLAGTNIGMTVFLHGIEVELFAYDIRFDGNGATGGEMPDCTCIYGRSYCLPDNQFRKEYYEFDGWCTTADGSGDRYKNAEEIRNLTSKEKMVTLYAQWKKTGVYNISLDHQDATMPGTANYYEWYGVDNYTTNDCVTKIEKVKVPEKAGYTFGGYYTTPNAGGIQYIRQDGTITATATTFSDATTLYAYWMPTVSKVTLDNQGADVAGTREFYQKYAYGNYTTISCVEAINKITNPTKSHYVFQGYFTKTNGEGERIIDANGSIISSYTLFASDTILYAYWKPMTYTITLDNQNPTTYGDTLFYQKYGEGFSKGYKEIGESKGSTITEFHYTGSEQVFVAPFNGKYFLQAYGAQSGGHAMGNGSEIFGVGGESSGTIYLNEGEMLRVYVGGKGIGFTGGYNGGGNGGAVWAASNDIFVVTGGGGATDFRKGGSQLEHRIMVAGGGGGVLHPQNTPYPAAYTMGGSSRGGYGAFSAIAISIDVAKQGTGMAFPKFELFQQMDQTAEKLSSNYQDVPTILEAGYSDTKYQVTAYLKGSLGNGVVGGGGGYIGGGYMQFYSNSGLIVGNVSAGPSAGSSYVKGVENGQMALKPQHTGNGRASITYEDFNCTVIEKETTSVVIPQREGYSFGGYYTGKNGIGECHVDSAGNIISSPDTYTSNITLYAYWLEKGSGTYKIVFDGNGANSGVMNNLTCNYNASYRLPKNAFTRSNDYGESTFLGWNTSPDTKDVLYRDEAVIINPTVGDGAVLRLYAIWEDCQWINITPEIIRPEGTLRFINEKYYGESYETGGLADNSIWKTNPEYIGAIERAFENGKNNTPILSCYFKYEDILRMKEFVHENGVGNSVYENALALFYEAFIKSSVISK